MKNKYTLCVCIPTYNRGDVLVPAISKCIQSDDRRFCITLQDNCSTDGSFERLSLIPDDRVRLRQNSKNIGGVSNSRAAISQNEDSDYILFSIDKDELDMDYLPEFIDFLEKEKPSFGFVDLYGEKTQGFVTYCKGADAILHTSYLSKHPSGFFWRREMLEPEIETISSNLLLKNFDFGFEIINAHFAVAHTAYIVHIPCIRHGKRLSANIKAALSSNKSITYNSLNYYFGVSKRIETFNLYISDLMGLQLSDKDKEKISLILLNRTMREVSTTLRQILHNNWESYHYNFKWRIMPLREMVSNINMVKTEYKKIMSDAGCHNSLKIMKAWCRCVLSSIKMSLRELIKRPKNIPYKA